jgi:hypothetical protein
MIKNPVLTGTGFFYCGFCFFVMIRLFLENLPSLGFGDPAYSSMHAGHRQLLY